MLMLRTGVPGVRNDAPSIEFEFEGRVINARPGETVAAALIAAGERELRESHLGTRRGVFCGSAVCAECLVRVDGVARRACMVPATHGSKVTRHPSQVDAIASCETPCASSLENVPDEVLTPDVLVVGAGPAGLSAARAAASAGLDVLVVDERRSAGGQYFKQPNEGFVVEPDRLDAQYRAGRKLIEDALAAKAKLLLQATVWGAFTPTQVVGVGAPGQLCVTTPEKRYRINPRRLVLAPGGYERAIPFHGWTLPGCMTTGAAQTLLRASQLKAGSRVLIAGNGPLNLQVASELTAAGAQVVALLETAAAPGIRSLPALLRMAFESPQLVLAGIKNLLSLRKRGVPVHYRHAISRVEEEPHPSGEGKQLVVTICPIDAKGNPQRDGEQKLRADAVSMGYGFLPQSELARALGCSHSYDERRGSLIVDRDAECRTSVPEIFVAGDAGGLGGAQVAMCQGTLAGDAIARDLGCVFDHAANRTVEAARRLLSRHLRFQSALWSMYAAPWLVSQLAEDDTYICRCEGITKAAVLAYAAQGLSLGSIKRDGRAGMGRCQGRYCAPMMAEILRQHSNKPLAETDFFAPRSPFRPTLIGSIASPVTASSQARQT
jgi:NADPH-dependent 2,4-dienoyl-CoA reductase/sulfur reductase-like enzyme